MPYWKPIGALVGKSISGFLRYLRLRPFPSDTESGRTSERYRRALLSVLANFASRSISMLIMVLSVSWTLPYLGVERFGAWMTIASLAAMLSFLDLGLGNALTNRVARVSSSGDMSALKIVVSGGLGVLAILSIILVPLLVGVALLLPWDVIIKLKTTWVLEEVRVTSGVFGAIFAITIFTNGVARISHGLQRGFEAYLASIFGSLFGLVALALAVYMHAGLPVLLVCSMVGSILGNMGLWCLLWWRDQFSVVGWGKSIYTESLELFRIGGLFFILQIGVMIGWGMDSLIIASVSGAVSVASFAVIQRLMQFVAQPLAIINAPLWAAYADASVRKDHVFIKRTFIGSMKLTLAVSIVGACLLFFSGGWLVELWTKSTVVPAVGLLGAMAFWLVLEAAGNSLAMLLNGLGVVRQQVWVILVFVAVALPLKFYLAQYFGALGVVLGGVIAYVPVIFFGYGVVFRKEILVKIS